MNYYLFFFRCIFIYSVSVICDFIYCIFWDLPNFYLQRGILSYPIPAWVSTYTLIMDANGWKYRVVTVGIRALVSSRQNSAYGVDVFTESLSFELNLSLLTRFLWILERSLRFQKSILIPRYSSSLDSGVSHNSTSNDLYSELAVPPISKIFL
jgi:hypothetical protein